MSNKSRFAGTKDDIRPLGKVVDVQDYLTDEQREANRKHDAALKSVFLGRGRKGKDDNT